MQLPILDTLQTTEHFPYVFKFPEQCLVTQGDFITATEYEEVFFIKMSSKDSFLLGTFSGSCILLLQQ